MLPVDEASRASGQEHVGGVQDMLAPVQGDADALLNSVNLDTKNFQLGYVPEGLERCELKTKGLTCQSEGMKGPARVRGGWDCTEEVVQIVVDRVSRHGLQNPV